MASTRFCFDLNNDMQLGIHVSCNPKMYLSQEWCQAEKENVFASYGYGNG